ncbi:MAG: hypothetical protein RL398_1258 [Planctomycetota bacterium]|jgi:flagellar biogenesis protein FliO
MPKWLLVPPAAALLLLLGPLSMQGNGRTGGTAPATNPAPAATTAAPDSPALGRASGRSPAAPKTVDMFEMGSALVAVLLLGASGIYVLRRLRGGAVPTGGTALMTLRQSVRLSAKNVLHAVEFDDRIVLVGEGERGLTLLDAGRIPERVADELEVTSRAGNTIDTVVADDEDDGAVPKNLVIPRPAQGPARRAPTPPKNPAEPRPQVGLGDFRALLQKAGR